MEFSQDDFDRLLLFEHTRKTAETNYAKNPHDAEVRVFFCLCYSECFIDHIYSILNTVVVVVVSLSFSDVNYEIVWLATVNLSAESNKVGRGIA
jgi:hypothetical protein